jgi:hypothetical protein
VKHCHYATNRKVAGSIPDEVNIQIYLILPAALGPGVYSSSNRNESPDVISLQLCSPKVVGVYFNLTCVSNTDNTSHEEEISNNRRKETLASPT